MFFFICKSIYILKVDSIHYILSQNTNVKNISLDKIDKKMDFFLLGAPIYHCYFLLAILIPAEAQGFISLMCVGFSIFDSILFL